MCVWWVFLGLVVVGVVEVFVSGLGAVLGGSGQDTCKKNPSPTHAGDGFSANLMLQVQLDRTTRNRLNQLASVFLNRVVKQGIR